MNIRQSASKVKYSQNLATVELTNELRTKIIDLFHEKEGRGT